MANQKYHTDPVPVELDGNTYWIRFKLAGGFIPGIGQFTAEQLVKREAQLVEAIEATKDAAEKRSLQARLVLPRLLASYVDKGQPISSSLFDFVPDPKTKRRNLEEIIQSEADLQDQVHALQAEIEKLQAIINSEAAPEAEPETPKKKK